MTTLGEGKLKKLGSLWIAKSKSGNKYIQGVVSGVKVIIFPNLRKPNDKYPDYTVYEKSAQGSSQARPKKEADEPIF